MSKLSTNEALNEITRLARMFESLKHGEELIRKLHVAEGEVDRINRQIAHLEKERAKVDEYIEGAIEKLNGAEDRTKALDENVIATLRKAQNDANEVLTTARLKAEQMVEEAQERIAQEGRRLDEIKAEIKRYEILLADARRDHAEFTSKAERERERIIKSLGG